MKFTSLASSSKGNAYLVEADGASPLLLEAGIPIKRLREMLYGLDKKITDLAGCLVSHEHQDHSRAVKALTSSGVDCYMSVGTYAAMLETKGEIVPHRIWPVKGGYPCEIGGWRILPFSLKHDAAEPLGFLVAHGFERLLFCPDTQMIVPKFKGLTIIVVEANYASDILTNNILNGSLPAVVGHRVRRSHMELGTVKNFLLASDISNVRAIHLCHLSDGNSDEARFKREIQETTGIPTYICE